jgi:hypothetical protein
VVVVVVTLQSGRRTCVKRCLSSIQQHCHYHPPHPHHPRHRHHLRHHHHHHHHSCLRQHRWSSSTCLSRCRLISRRRTFDGNEDDAEEDERSYSGCMYLLEMYVRMRRRKRMGSCQNSKILVYSGQELVSTRTLVLFFCFCFSLERLTSFFFRHLLRMVMMTKRHLLPLLPMDPAAAAVVRHTPYP